MDEKIKKLEEDVQAQVAANATLTEKVGALEKKLEAYRDVLIADIVANSTFEEKELKDKSFDEIEVIQNTLSKVKRLGADPFELGNTTTPEAKSLADRIKELNK